MEQYETIQDMTRRFDQFKNGRKGCALKQGVWHREIEAGKIRACALGAFFGTHQADAKEYRGYCIGNYAPHWLMDATPIIFDTPYELCNDPGFHVRWAAVIYGTDGVIDRASKITPEERQAVYDAAEQRLLKCAEINPYRHKRVFSMLQGPASAEQNKEIASTIVNLLDYELVKRGA